jgi:O-antigen/teichoic acid export membrane protein
MAATAPVALPLLFGDRWLPGVGVLQALALGALVSSLGYFDSGLLQAVGRPVVALGTSALGLMSAALGITVGLHFGIVGVAVGLSLASLITWPIRLVILKRVSGISPARVVGQWIRPVLAAALMALAVTGFLRLELGPSWLQLLCAIVVGAVVYLAALRVLAPAALTQLVTTLRTALRTRAAVGSLPPA